MPTRKAKSKPTRKAKSKPKFSWDTTVPLENLGAESDASNKALVDYALMGAQRSLAKLCERYQGEPKPRPPTKRLATLKGWSSRFEWQARVIRFDVLEAQRNIEKWREREESLREADWDLGKELREAVKKFLKELPMFIETTETMTSEQGSDGELRDVLVRVIGLKTSLQELARAGKVSSELQRLATDLPTEISQQLGGAALDSEIQKAIGDYVVALVESGIGDEALAEELRRYVRVGSS